MSGSKRSVPFAIACLFVSASCTGAMAGQTSESPLDPYSYTPAAQHEARGGKGAAANIAPEAEPAQTYVTMPAPEGKEGAGKSRIPKVKLPKVSMPHVPHPHIPMIGKKDSDSADKNVASSEPKPEKESKLASKADRPGLLDKTKQIGSGLASKTKEAGEGLGDKTKGIENGLANGAKSSADFFKKVPSALGSGFKSAGEKVKDGTEKVAHLGRKDSATAKSTYPNVKPMNDKSVVAKSAPPKPTKVAHQPKESTAKMASNPNPGLMDKTLGKLKFWGHDKGPSYPTANNAATAGTVGTTPH